MPYESTPVEPTPQPSAYDHLSPYTSLAPSWPATPRTTPPPPMVTAAPTGATTPGRRLPRGVWLVLIPVILILQAVVRTPTTAPEDVGSHARASASAFSVTLLDGWSSSPVTDPSMVLRLTSSGETFSVWSSPSYTSAPCDQEVTQHTASSAGGRTPVTFSLDGTLATGTKVESPISVLTVVCLPKDAQQYLIEDQSTAVATSSFDLITFSWRWK